MKNNFFQRLILPGLVLQSTMIRGGSATGRELIEFFLQMGPISGLVAMLISTVVISIVSMAAFEFARTFSLYDYRLLFKKLLGPGWFIFEIAYLALIILVLSVIGAASGELIHSLFNIPMIWGTVILMIATGVLVFFGSAVIEKFLSSWSIILYIAYTVLIIWSISTFGDKISANLYNPEQAAVGLDTFKGGWSYAGYNIVVVTAALFVARHFESRSDSMWAGLLCGPLSIIPGLLLFIAMIAHYPEVVEQSLPISYLLEQLNAPGFMLIFQVVIFGTFIETGTALLHSVNERIAEVYLEKENNMPQFLRPTVALIMLFVAIYLADAVGIVSLIGQGYAYSSYLFLSILVLPLLTRGIWLILKK